MAALGPIRNHPKPENPMKSKGARRSGTRETRESRFQVLAGIALGAAAAAWLSKYPLELPFQDPSNLAVVAALPLVNALIATLLPARRAMGRDPVTTLRRRSGKSSSPIIRAPNMHALVLDRESPQDRGQRPCRALAMAVALRYRVDQPDERRRRMDRHV